jgi:hypothetical protein
LPDGVLAKDRVRLDGGFTNPEVLDFLEGEAVEYVVAMASNVRLLKRVRRLMGRARMRSKASGKTEALFGETRYACPSPKPRPIRLATIPCTWERPTSPEAGLKRGSQHPQSIGSAT